MSNIAEVIGWKHNHQAEMSTADGVITAFPGGIPSAEDQAVWTTQYESYLASIAYITARKVEYKSLEEQADMRYWDSVNGTTLLNDHIAKVKSDNPKG